MIQIQFGYSFVMSLKNCKNEIHLFLDKKKIFPFLVFRNFLNEKNRIDSTTISTNHYLLFFSYCRSSLPVQWMLKMFDEHLEIERENSNRTFSSIDSNLISIVKQQLLDCIQNKNHRQLAAQCLAKFSSIYQNDQEFNIDEHFYEPIPTWIIDDLLLIYLIDDEQNIVECTRSTIKSIFHHSIGQELYHHHSQDSLIQLYSKPFLIPIVISEKKILSDPLNSNSNPWLISMNLSFDRWLKFLVEFLFKQIQHFYQEKNEKGHPYASIFLQMKSLIQLKTDLSKKVFPHLIYSLLLLPSTCNTRTLLSKKFTFLLDQLLEKKYLISSSIAQLIFRTINYLRQCPIEQINKRNAGKSVLLSFENHFWLDIDYFQLAKCASKYECYQSAILYADIWATKQRFSFLDE